MLIGSGIGGVRGIEDTTIALHEGGPRKVSPFYVPSTIINMVSGQLSYPQGLQGPELLGGIRLRHRRTTRSAWRCA